MRQRNAWHVTTANIKTAVIEHGVGYGGTRVFARVCGWWDGMLGQVVCRETLLCCIRMWVCALFVFRSYRNVQMWLLFAKRQVFLNYALVLEHRHTAARSIVNET